MRIPPPVQATHSPQPHAAQTANLPPPATGEQIGRPLPAPARMPTGPVTAAYPHQQGLQPPASQPGLTNSGSLVAAPRPPSNSLLAVSRPQRLKTRTVAQAEPAIAISGRPVLLSRQLPPGRAAQLPAAQLNASQTNSWTAAGRPTPTAPLPAVMPRQMNAVLPATRRTEPPPPSRPIPARMPSGSVAVTYAHPQGVQAPVSQAGLSNTGSLVAATRRPSNSLLSERPPKRQKATVVAQAEPAIATIGRPLLPPRQLPSVPAAHFPGPQLTASQIDSWIAAGRPALSAPLPAVIPRQMDAMLPAAQRAASPQPSGSVDPFPMPDNWETLSDFDSADLREHR